MVRIYYNCIQGRGVCYLFTILVQNVPVKIKTRRSFFCRSLTQAEYVEGIFKKVQEFEMDGNAR